MAARSDGDRAAACMPAPVLGLRGCPPTPRVGLVASKQMPPGRAGCDDCRGRGRCQPLQWERLELTLLLWHDQQLSARVRHPSGHAPSPECQRWFLGRVPAWPRAASADGATQVGARAWSAQSQPRSPDGGSARGTARRAGTSPGRRRPLGGHRFTRGCPLKDRSLSNGATLCSNRSTSTSGSRHPTTAW